MVTLYFEALTFVLNHVYQLFFLEGAKGTVIFVLLGGFGKGGGIDLQPTWLTKSSFCTEISI